ncbi:MAG: aspartate aminotransferase family protein [Anaerolineae bacterium]|nr:aspartate aminotransferase family protein [Anaerolineae bacterium]
MFQPQPLDTASIIALEDQYATGVYSKRQVALVKGQGARVWDADGKEYIDCAGGTAVASVGHANPMVLRAIARQANTMITCQEMFYNDKRALVMKKLCSLSGMSKVFLCNSGTEAVEAAIKFARVLTGRTEIVAAMRGFHGRTMGSLSATWEKKYREPFEPLVPGFKHIVYNDIVSLEAAVSDQTAAVILEIVQGEGGVRPGDPAFLQRARELCTEKGALLIFDEIQTGFGRTGKWFAKDHYNLQPDMLCLAKAIGGGLPMGATLLAEGMGAIPPMVHGTTFGGNPLVCAASLAAIGYMEEHHLPERSARHGEWFLNELSKIQSPLIREVRGKGLMVGIELKQKVAPYIAALMQKGVLAINAGMTVIRFVPPLVIPQQDLGIVAEKVAEVLSEAKADE